MTRSIRLGAICWLLTVIFPLAQAIAQAAWPQYSMVTNDISLLGVTTCGQYVNEAPGGIAYVCSPLSVVFNAGMILNGIMVVLGAWLTSRAWPPRWLATAGLWLLAIGGDGSILVGLFPLNVYFPLHAVGALLALGVADLGFLCLAIALRRQSPRFALYCLLTGLVTLSSFVLYLAGYDLGIGRGVLERLAAWPHTLWYMIAALLILRGAFGTEPSSKQRVSAA